MGVGRHRPPRERLSTAARTVSAPLMAPRNEALADGVIPLGMGETDLSPIPGQPLAAAFLLEAGTGPAPEDEMMIVKEITTERIYESLGIAYRPDEILYTRSPEEAVALAVRSVVNPGDDVLIPEPCFVHYGPAVRQAGGWPIPVPLSADHGFALLPETLDACITPRSHVLLLNYPHNPTGAVMTPEQLRRLVPIIERFDLTVVSDDVYSELTYDGPHVPLAALEGMQDRTILLNTFSVSMALTGWRLGLAAGPADLVQGMAHIQGYPTLTRAAELRFKENWAPALARELAAWARSVYDQRRHMLQQALSSLGLSCTPLRGGLFAFPSIAHTGLTDQEFADRLLREERVAVVPGSVFGEMGRGHIRFSYSLSPDRMEMAFERIGRFLARLA